VFSLLIATRPPRERSTKGTVASVLVHGMIFTTLIVASAQRDTEIFTDPGDRVVVIDPYRHEPEPAPSSPEPPAPSTPTEPAPPVVPETPPEIPQAPTDIPSTLPDPGLPTNLPADPVPSTPSTGEPGTGEPTNEPSGSPEGAFSAGEVDRPVALLPRSPLPRYPDMLRSSRLEGGVRVVFVVDANGRVEMESVRIIDASHPLFAEAVRSVLPRMRFRPAQAGNRRVRQLVEIPFGFTLTGR
jgi:protein TonB